MSLDVTLAALTQVVDGTLDAKLEPVIKNQDKLIEALTGNGFGANKGLIPRVEDLEACETLQNGEIDKLWRRWDKAKWVSVGVGLGYSATGGSFVFVLSKMFA